MTRLHVIYDPEDIVQVPPGDVSRGMRIKVAMIDLPEDDTATMEELAKELALRLLAQFHQPDV